MSVATHAAPVTILIGALGGAVMVAHASLTARRLGLSPPPG